MNGKFKFDKILFVNTYTGFKTTILRLSVLVHTSESISEINKYLFLAHTNEKVIKTIAYYYYD